MLRRRTQQDAFRADTDAADGLRAIGVSLSAISRRLQRIEEHLGIPKNDEGPGTSPGPTL